MEGLHFLYLFYLCVYVCVWCVHVCTDTGEWDVHVWVSYRAPRLMSCIFLRHSPPSVLRQGPPLNPGFTGFATLARWLAPEIPSPLPSLDLGRIQTPILRHVTSVLPTESLEKNFLLVRHRDVGAVLCLWHNFMNAELTWFHCSSHWKLFRDIHPADCDRLPQPVRRSLFIS